MTTPAIIALSILGPIVLPLWIICTAAMWKLFIDGIKEVSRDLKIKKALKKQLKQDKQL